ncbi:putative disease resistance protein At3g14460 [Vicia villosa]|uniref:putative disease resistance protein At3g14460 n=1 Tax=Vicia villosa TaxID=3911 RepID=UPI00273BB633|nr:putative disease resistance protein At3g14460 [Vicia villosa]XP_058754756.1 putative disease resistance protein At3g14460 [Vicia villosa]
MAAAAVGEAFLSAFIEVVLDRLSSPQLVDLVRRKKLDVNLVQRLKNTLYAVEAVLNDAEQKQIHDSSVNKWLDDLKDALYLADDILDHISTKAVLSNNNNKQVSTVNYFSRFFNFEERDMVRKLEDIVARLEYILKFKDILGLQHIATHHSSWRTPSTSLEDRSIIFGRDHDKQAILKLLLHDDDKTGVIPIVGMGGLGKTTLAQFVYNHDDIKSKFDVKAWVCVSDDFDVLKVTKFIAEEVGSTCSTNSLNILHRDLKKKLTGKRFLIVLDDVWTEDDDSWNSLIKPLQYGSIGSKILVTTRSEKVASMVQTFQPYSLHQLSDKDCLSVFANNVCLSPDDNMDLRKIGKEIVRKCKGLPLAAQSLGRLLREKRDIRDWNSILNNNIWENKSKIIPALRISYHYLPPYLKRCFVYCSLFPKDYQFDKHKLILLWMAEDLLHPSGNNKTLEEVGYGYFNDLASKSFFQHSGYGYFVMHDLVHDLATWLGGEFYFRTEVLGKDTKIGAKTRHLSFSKFSDPISANFDVFRRIKSLRTISPIYSWDDPFNQEKVSCFILSNMKYLRVLKFGNFEGLDAFLNSIDELIHLRYLDLSSTSIKMLPESLCNLYNLQTLKLYNCKRLTRLPNDMQNLVNLRHLEIRGTNLKEMPREMSKLINLQRLGCFVVGTQEAKGIKELGTLSNLHGSLSVRKLENVTNSFEASQANIMDKMYLNKLSFVWSKDAKNHFQSSQSEMDILGKLQPSKNLKMLDIDGYRGTLFPEWVGHPSYQNLTEVSLYGCLNCCILPSLGQLCSLKVLTISKMNMLETIGTEYDNTFSGTYFPSLERLEFFKMSFWKVWHHPHESNVYFPVLKSIVINDCPRLHGDLPSYLPALDTIRIEGCNQLVSSLPRAPAIRRLYIFESNNIALNELPLSLEELDVKGSEVTESVFEAITITPPISLKKLVIRDCSSAISFPRDCLPLSLESLSITNSSNLDFPKPNHGHESLKYLFIDRSCDSLITLPLDTLPNLHHLRIGNCENIESLSVSKVLQNLDAINISDCPKFVSFPGEGLSAPNLSSLYVSNCVNLKSLSCHINTLLPKLVSMSIYECPKLEMFPEGGMPPSFRTILIANCEKLLMSTSLTSMDMLTHLCIDGPCDGVEYFPKKGYVLLPPSLIYLHIYNHSSLHTLDCTGLLHLTSLQALIIRLCPKLENIVGERLPASLIELNIFECPLLKGQYRVKYPQISHIPRIVVDNKWI